MTTTLQSHPNRTPYAAPMQHPRLCFIGPLVGMHFGNVTTQPQILVELFRGEGYPVIAASSCRNRYVRLLDIVQTVISRRREMDVLVLAVYSGASFVVEDIVSRLAKRLKIPLVMFLHGGSMPDFMARYPRWTRRVLRRADLILAPSPFLARAVEPYGFHADVLPNVIDLSEYTFKQRRVLEPRLLWMRTFHPIYNPSMAIRVLARVREKYPNATLVMGGEEKGLLEETRRHTQELGLQNAVHFAGFLDMANKVRYGSQADIFINTNHVDNTPVSVIEACALGLPVVATQVGGIPDLLTEGRTGLMVPDNDDQAMAQAILRLLETPDLAEQMSHEGRQLAEHCSWKGVLPLWNRVFQMLLDAKPVYRMSH